MPPGPFRARSFFVSPVHMVGMETKTLTLIQFALVALAIASIVGAGITYNGLSLLALVSLTGAVIVEKAKSLRTGLPMFH